jgi:hypothetical protein
MSDRVTIDRSEMNVLFVHSDIDDFGLSPAEFRVYAHIARRAGQSSCWPGIDSIATTCRLHTETVVKAIKALEVNGLLEVIRKTGVSNVYRLTKRSQWKEQPPLAIFDHPEKRERTPRKSANATPRKSANESTSIEVHPTKVIHTPSGGDNEQAEAIYRVYPKKVGKPVAIKAILKALKKTSYDALLEAVKKFSVVWNGNSLDYCPHPSTWFNQERYKDDPETWVPRKNGHTGPPVHIQMEQIEKAIEVHPANPQWIGYSKDRVTDAARADLKFKRQKLQELQQQSIREIR